MRKIDMEIGGENEYGRAKRILDKGKHPAFVGRNTIISHARNGGLFFAVCEEKDIGIVVLNPKKNNLLVLNILPEYRGKGIGKFLVDYFKSNFARVIETKVDFFTKRGYVPLGKPKKGKKYLTYIMIRESIRRKFACQ